MTIKGKYIRTDEMRARSSASRLGGKLSYETRLKMHLSSRGNNPNWTPGRKQTPHGYIQIQMPQHPFASRAGKWVYEHRVLIEEARRITLNPWTVVHHKNQIKHDNRLDNLQVMTNSQHAALHAAERKVIKLCVEQGCGRERKAKGMCNPHYLKYRRGKYPELFKTYGRNRRQKDRERKAV